MTWKRFIKHLDEVFIKSWYTREIIRTIKKKWEILVFTVKMQDCTQSDVFCNIDKLNQVIFNYNSERYDSER